MVSRLGEASILPFDTDPGELSLALSGVGVLLAAVALLVVLRSRPRRAARGGRPDGPADEAVPPPPAAGPHDAAAPGAVVATGPTATGALPTVVGPRAALGADAEPPSPAPPAATAPAAAAAVPDAAAASAAAFAVAARRDITLLDRQLRALDELERTETDPDTLQQLFLLDNLAMRLRRGAESLLVLAGSPPGRRVRESTAVSDVVRTASSQIESYERVRVDLDDDPPLAAVHVVPLAHLLAELLENGTVFSAPDTTVDVGGRCDEDAMHLTVRDRGLGMTADERAAAEAAVRDAGRAPAGSERLGLAVVGALAARLGLAVTFAEPADGPGTAVTVRLPRELFDVDGPEAVPVGLDEDAVLPEPELGGLAALPDLGGAGGPGGPGGPTGPGVPGGVPGAPSAPGPPPEEYVPLVAPAPDGDGGPARPSGPRRTATSGAHPVPDTVPELGALPSFDAILSGDLPAPPHADGHAAGAPHGLAAGPPDGLAHGRPDARANGRSRHAHGLAGAADPPPATGSTAAPAGVVKALRGRGRSASSRRATAPPTAPTHGVAPPGAPGEVFYPDPEPAPRGVPGPAGPSGPSGPILLPGGATTAASGPTVDAHASFAERASLQRQALAELSSISSYRPEATGTGVPSLTRRTPSAVQEADAAPDDAIVRDAEALRARLTAFRAGTARGTRDGTGPGPLGVPDLTSTAEEAR